MAAPDTLQARATSRKDVYKRQEWGIIGNLAGQNFPVYRFLPHRVKGEGFFLAVLRKSAAIYHAVPVSYTHLDVYKRQQ